MRTLYLDLFSGISGDMLLGALIDLGVDARRLERDLKKLRLDGYHLHVSHQQRSGIQGVKFDVELAETDRRAWAEGRGHGHSRDTHQATPTLGHGHGHRGSRNFTEIKRLITRSQLSPWVKRKSISVFNRIALAEGQIHGLPSEQVHFHEVGAVDSIVDIVGACLALELMGKPRVQASPVVEGVGWVDCAHGRFPVPAPATLAILGARGIGVTQCSEPHELVTPTGAALLAEFAESFQPMANLAAEKIGFGLGTRINQTRPNALRAVLGRTGVAPVSNSRSRLSGKSKTETGATPVLRDWETDTVAVLEANLDDVSGEVLGHFVDLSLERGALDVFFTPIQMKKSRPAVLLTVLCTEADADNFSELILRETSTFGVRRHLAERRKLRRQFTKAKTACGEVSVKLGMLDGKVIHAAPEYESCRRAARKAKVPLKQVYDATMKALNR